MRGILFILNNNSLYYMLLACRREGTGNERTVRRRFPSIFLNLVPFLSARWYLAATY
jgi:hypothetical protein